MSGLLTLLTARDQGTSYDPAMHRESARLAVDICLPISLLYQDIGPSPDRQRSSSTFDHANLALIASTHNR